MDILGEIWNRAAGFDGAEDFRAGDRALHDALVLHGQVMNGGLLNAVETLEHRELADGVAGLEWLGLTSIARKIAVFAVEANGVQDAAALDALEERGNNLYWAELGEDAVLDAAFQAAHARDPEAFAPVR
ncbi:hypothetical protein [Georgenia sp. SUBG003]|uniref:hypothetical protein n=1 Tax=Georgenia sp. SUBG003 TaxID=1497974 RepID=UPI0004D7804F|nr:hypothetical protein DA06_07345 [Georgenia sp. SUBG003]